MIQPNRVLLLALGLGLLAGCDVKPPESAIEFRVPVFVKPVETGDVEDRVVATGTLRATETIALNADSTGALQIARDSRGRRLNEGDVVAAGDVIAEITGDDVRLNARSESTRQRFLTTKADHESKRELFESGLLSKQEFLQVEASLADARLDWERSQLTESRSRLTTPISGVILKLARDQENMPLADGQLVAQGYTVAQIAPTDTLIADVDLVGPDASRVRRGLNARVRHHGWEQRSFDGKVLRLAPTLDPLKRTLRAEVGVNNAAGLLKPGMFVEVTIVADRREGVPVAPREAIAERGGRKVVFVLNGQRVSRREVTLGLGDDEIVEIREGLEPGERIVTRGIETLTDQSRVRVSGA